MTNAHNRTYTLSITGVLGALIILQSYLPMIGYITVVPGLPAISTIHVTVIVAASLLGPKMGMGLGTLWGVVSMIKAYTEAGDPLSLLLFQNPIIAILPRLAVGLVAGVIAYSLWPKVTGVKRTIKLSVAGILGALTNTVLVIALTWLLRGSAAVNLIPQANLATLGIVLFGMFFANAVAEMILAGIVTPLIVQPLLRFKR
ncbi:ECF transporter S component [Lacticaseibacillus saniviri]|uniref:Membrane protein n=1 Tax=Lacticaseibacillus saniviri JCM 17471 = DSM 24301 TaxID=1293598 RepID=A0A0R2MUQ9_9LACO|nr:ECF transporter S component [Lacticaseibacillus saniviri]KRO16027.1 membrane protein [Lacticaseibacillus saniviri JCM 17471 = DSM 24301]